MESAKPSGKQEKNADKGAENAAFKLHVNQAPEGESLDFILDIPLKVSVELGRSKILVQDLLKLHKGSVIELNKIAGEPLEVLVNDRVLAKGEVVVVNEKFGVRLTEVVSHPQRIRQLGDQK
jgi:flagellar motor switch protein FliN/FliY